jgi:hypothetical protein
VREGDVPAGGAPRPPIHRFVQRSVDGSERSLGQPNESRQGVVQLMPHDDADRSGTVGIIPRGIFQAVPERRDVAFIQSVLDWQA